MFLVCEGFKFKGGCLVGGRASFLGSGWFELHEHLLGVREVLYYLATPCVIQVHLPVHLPCYDLPPLYPLWLYRIWLGWVRGE